MLGFKIIQINKSDISLGILSSQVVRETIFLGKILEVHIKVYEFINTFDRYKQQRNWTNTSLSV